MNEARSHAARLVALAGAVCVAFAGCAPSQVSTAVGRTPSPTRSAMPYVDAIANGRSIFLYGRDLNGVRITAIPPPLFQNCAACHRADGSGGRNLPNGAVSADLRYASLVVHQTRPYTVPLLERAISTGIDNMGQRLNPVMPRWHLSTRDLQDIARYVHDELK